MVDGCRLRVVRCLFVYGFSFIVGSCLCVVLLMVALFCRYKYQLWFVVVIVIVACLSCGCCCGCCCCIGIIGVVVVCICVVCCMLFVV